MTFLKKLESLKKEGEIPEKIYAILRDLFLCYTESVKKNAATYDLAEINRVFEAMVRFTAHQLKSPHHFASYHEAIRSPIDYYQLGLDFTYPLIKDLVLHGFENLKKADEMIKKNENVIFLANHQTELDPQIISTALQNHFKELAEHIIFVAGDRVVTDPIAVPFSLGRNLLCIYSKRHVDHPPEKKMEKLMHNQRTMRVMKELLTQGGKCIYVAPSGGRDRMNAQGVVPLAPFEANNIEMFRLMAEQAGHVTHFFPLALFTHDMLPPPRDIENELGEMRIAHHTKVLFSFGKEIDMKNFPGHQNPDRLERRKALAEHIYHLVDEAYQKLLKEAK